MVDGRAALALATGVDITVDAIFVVSLERALDRRANVAHQFGRLETSVPFEIWDAVDGYALRRDERALADVWREGLVSPRAKVFSTHPKWPGILGFSLSYLRLFRHIKERALAWALVLEDDFEFVHTKRDPRVYDIRDGAELVSLDTRMNRRGVGTMGTIFSASAVGAMLRATPLNESVDIWLSKHSYGFVGGENRHKGDKRFLFMDTESYDDQNRLLKGSSYRHVGSEQAIWQKSYLQGDD